MKTKSAMGKRTFSLRAFGLRPNEGVVLKSVCLLSGHAARACSHQLAENGVPPDIYVVDGADAQAVAQWRAADPVAARPVVLIGAAIDGPMRGTTLQRPLLASRLLSTLDEIARTEQRAGPATLLPVTMPPMPARAPAAAPAAAAAPAMPAAAYPGTSAGTSVGTSTGTSAGASVSASAGTTQSPAAAPVAPAVPRGAVLVVDDSPTVRKHLDLVLRDAGLDTVCVATGEEALDEISQREFMLVLLDVVLPGSDGYHVCKTIKKTFSSRLPVVMLTSRSSPFDRIRGSLAGCDAYLVKPVDKAAFMTTLNKYLKSAGGTPVAAPHIAAQAPVSG